MSGEVAGLSDQERLERVVCRARGLGATGNKLRERHHLLDIRLVETVHEVRVRALCRQVPPSSQQAQGHPVVHPDADGVLASQRLQPDVIPAGV